MPGARNDQTIWHITLRTYGTWYATDDAASAVSHGRESPRRPRPGAIARPRSDPVQLSRPQRHKIESSLPEICTRGGWQFLACAAASNHVHLLCTAPHSVPGKTIQALLKRWLTQTLNERNSRSASKWWADGGSTRSVTIDEYRANAQNYIARQRTT